MSYIDDRSGSEFWALMNGVLVGVCTIKFTRWPAKHGHYFETGIEELYGFGNDDFLDQQVSIALVRMLWDP